MSKGLLSKVAFHGNYHLGPIVRSESREQVGKHPVLLLDFPVPRRSTRAAHVPERTPVIFRFGYTTPGESRTFYGYVNHHEVIDGTADRVLRLYCIGTSLGLNEPHAMSWTHVTGSHIARQIAERHHLRAIVHKSAEVLPYWAQGAETDFQMMRRLSERTGYRFWVDGPTLHFLDPERAVTTPHLRFVPRLQMNGQVPDDIKGIHVVAGSLAPRADGGPAVRKIYGLDPRSGALLKSTSARPLSERGLDIPQHTVIGSESVRDAAQARVLSEAHARQSPWVNAQATLRGHPTLRLGDVVSLDGNLLHNDYRGLWVMEATTNVIEQTSNRQLRMTTEVEISRNQATRQFLTVRTPLNSSPRTVAAVLRNGAWESQVLESVYV